MIEWYPCVVISFTWNCWSLEDINLTNKLKSQEWKCRGSKIDIKDG